jgi:uncharacterized membrane protein (DUF441 family)
VTAVSNLAQWAAIVAFLVPIVVSFLNQTGWPSWLKATVFFAVSLVAAAGTAYFEGDFSGKRFLDAALIIVAAGAAFYHGWWKPSGIAPLIEQKTNLPTSNVPPPAPTAGARR